MKKQFKKRGRSWWTKPSVVTFWSTADGWMKWSALALGSLALTSSEVTTSTMWLTTTYHTIALAKLIFTTIASAWACLERHRELKAFRHLTSSYELSRTTTCTWSEACKEVISGKTSELAQPRRSESSWSRRSTTSKSSSSRRSRRRRSRATLSRWRSRSLPTSQSSICSKTWNTKLSRSGMTSLNNISPKPSRTEKPSRERCSKLLKKSQSKKRKKKSRQKKHQKKLKMLEAAAVAAAANRQMKRRKDTDGGQEWNSSSLINLSSVPSKSKNLTLSTL